MKNAESDPGSSIKNDKVIVIGDIGPGDSIWVQTQRSNYLFSLVEPTWRRGTLTGGLLGEQVLEAVLAGETSEDKTHFDSSELKAGSRALFFLETKGDLHRLLTSVITNVAHIAGSHTKWVG